MAVFPDAIGEVSAQTIAQVTGPAWSLRPGFGDVALRLLAALACGAAIGVEREKKGAPPDCARTCRWRRPRRYSPSFPSRSTRRCRPASGTSPPIRCACSRPLRPGVAFLADGTIIRRGGDVQGITTGGSLWLAGALGMSCGQALHGLSFLGAGLALVVLALVRMLEQRTLR